MITYAQNFEDVMLNRAFRDIENGFYIDVGAWRPDIDSVTRYFYDKGWNGINIEPVSEYAHLLRNKRTRDITLNVAVGVTAGRMSFHIVPGTGLSSGKPQLAAAASQLGYGQQEREVEVTTLAAVCDRYCPDRTIHFLKIDAEGMETDVIQGMDWRRYRPYLVVAEAVRPNSQIPSHNEWEHILVGEDYQFVWFDGVNRFYLRNENLDLSRHFSAPPNVFDNFQSARTVELQNQLEARTNTRCARFMGRICASLGKLRRLCYGLIYPRHQS